MTGASRRDFRRASAQQTGEQRDESNADQRHAAARDKLLDTLAFY